MRWIIAVFLGACSYGVLSTFVVFAYREGFHVGEVTGSQMFLGAVMLWILAGFKATNRATAKEWGQLLAVGITAGLTGLFYFACLQYLSASIAIVMLFQFTWIGVLIDSLMERKRPGWEKLLALALLLSGTVLAGGVIEGGIQQFSFTGLALGFLSGISYALQIAFSGKVALRVNSWSRSAIMMTGSTITVFLIFPPGFLVDGSLLHGLLFWGILLALFGTVITTLLFNIGVPRIGVGLSSILGAAELPTSVLLSSFVLHEIVSPLQWFGVVVILVGVTLPEWINRRKPAAAADGNGSDRIVS